MEAAAKQLTPLTLELGGKSPCIVHKDAKVEKIFLGNMDNFIYNNDGSLTILPNEYMDGFYIAKISKK